MILSRRSSDGELKLYIEHSTPNSGLGRLNKTINCFKGLPNYMKTAVSHDLVTSKPSPEEFSDSFGLKWAHSRKAATEHERDIPGGTEGCRAVSGPFKRASVGLRACYNWLSKEQLLSVPKPIPRWCERVSCSRKHRWYRPGRTGRSPKGPLVGEMPRTTQSNRKLICSLSADVSRNTPAPEKQTKIGTFKLI